MRFGLFWLVAACQLGNLDTRDGWDALSQPLNPGNTLSEQSPPPFSPELTLRVSPLVLGDAATFRVEGATPGAMVRLAFSFVGVTPGICPSVLQGECLGIGAPSRLLQRSMTADASGVATMTLTLPSQASADYVAFQAVEPGTARMSLPLGTSLLPAGTVAGLQVDHDQDGFTPETGDCADGHVDIFPGAEDVEGDAVDSNCDGWDGLDPCLLDPTCAPAPVVPTVDGLDYATWYWPTNHRPSETWPTPERVSHFYTGHYALAYDEELGQVTHFGPLNDEMAADPAQWRPNADIEALPAAQLTVGVGLTGDAIEASAFEGVASASIDRIRMIDGGRFMNRVVVPRVVYSDDAAVVSEMEIASMPRHVVFTQRVSGSDRTNVARVGLAGAAVDAFANATWLSQDKALTLTDDAGDGWLFAVYDGDQITTTLTYDPVAGVMAEATSSAAAVDGVEVSLLVAPLSALGERELDMYLDPAGQVQVDYTLLDVAGAEAAATVPAPWEPSLGAYLVPLAGLQSAGAAGSPNYDTTPESHNHYSRHRLTVDTGSDSPLAVPIAMHSHVHVTWHMTSGAAMLRDDMGEPLGVPVQVSKNWHEGYWDNWYHFYTQPTFAGSEPESVELTIASSRWGQAYAASYAQLSLIGYGEAGGNWQQSAIGAFGESVTYDPDKTLGRSLVDDVRPLLVDAGTRWNWTGNVGGADFLRYRDASRPWLDRRLQRVRTQVYAPGPNLTDVRFTGVSSDGGAIEADIRVQMGATDDLVRTWYHLDYTFVEDVPYDRFALFQVAADNYSDNGFNRMAYGNALGFTDAAVVPSGSVGYPSDDDRGIVLDGPAPWVMLYDSDNTSSPHAEYLADVGFVVRDFEAVIGDAVLTTPHINLFHTNNWGVWPQISFELGLPHETGSPWCGDPCGGATRFIPAGSRIRATVEYLVPPADKAAYYGVADYLDAMSASEFGSPEMMRTLAAGNDITVSASVGQVRRVHPVELESAAGAEAARFELSGGLGYMPVTVTGLRRHDGWRLEQQTTSGWVPLEQDVHGNDSWQARYVPEDGTWSLTWSVPNRGTNQYRVVWESR